MLQLKKFLIYGFALGFVITNGAFGAQTAKYKISSAGELTENSPEMTAAIFDKGVKEAKARATRKVAASDVITEQALSDSFRNLRNELIGGPIIKDGKETGEGKYPGINTPELLHTFLKKLNDDAFFNTLAPDAQFAAAQMAPLIDFHGILNRAIKLIEPYNVTHMAAVTALRSFAAGVLVFAPTEQWIAGLQYISKPTDDMGRLIDTEEDVHTFIRGQLLPSMNKMIERLKKLNFASKPIYFDNQVFYPAAHFMSDRDRYVRMGEAERNAALSKAYFTLSSLESLNAYSLNGLFQAIDTVSKHYGFSSDFYNPEKTKTKIRIDEIKKISAKTGLFQRRPGARVWMKASYNNLKWAVAYGKWSWDELHGAANGDSIGNLLDPRSFAASDRMIDTAYGNQRYMVMGDGQLAVQNAVVSSETRQVTLQNFFLNPPESLIDLMPTGFDPSPYTETATVNIDGKSIKRDWHNYLSGRPTQWPLGEFQKIFPEIKSNDDVFATARILSQSWGGWLLGVPLSAVIF